MHTHTLLHSSQNQAPMAMDSSSKSSAIKRHRTKFTIFSSLLLLIFLLLIVFSNTVFSPSVLRNLKTLPFPTFTPSPNYELYCRLYPYEDICHDSRISTSNLTIIFSTSIQFAINTLNATATSIAKAQSTNASPVLSDCLNRVHESIRELNASLGVASDIMWLTDEEVREMMIRTRAAKVKGFRCLGALKEAEKEKVVMAALEEVKLGVEKAIKRVSNVLRLLYVREGSWFQEQAYGYYYNGLVFSDVYLVYGTMYVIIAVLYFLFWRM